MSTVAKKVLMGGGAVAEPLEIEQSLIFDGTSSYLSKTPGTAGNRRTYTLSCWAKLIGNGATQYIYGGTNTTTTSLRLTAVGKVQVFDIVSNSVLWNIKTNRVLRDPSSWYHIAVAVDTTQGTAANRVKIYVNGVQETSFAASSYPDQNYQGTINNTVVQYIGKNFSSSTPFYFNGYLAEFNLIDGTALTPSSFGETNDDTGQWIPKEYSGSYGTNGFYLKFASGALGTDSSGEGNNYTATNLANSDVVIDTPTNNFATMNPLVSATSGMVLSEGNLKGDFRSASIANAQQAVSTIAMPAGSGKWYWEMRNTYTGLGFILGIVPKGELPRITSSGSFGYGYVNVGGVKNINGAESSYGTAWFSSGQTYIISCYYDSDNRKIGFKLNNTDQGYSSEDVTAGSYVAILSNASGGTASFPTVVNFGQNGTFTGTVTAQGNADANGIGDFYYAPPSGYKALCTANLPDPAIPLSSAQFNTVLYTGNGSTQSISGVGHQPDWVWIKNRATTDNHVLTDAVRGATIQSGSNLTGAEVTNDDGLTAFASDGFAIGDDVEVNTNSEAYVSWNWKANGSGSTNTVGSLDAVVSSNAAAGFSIVTYTGNGSAHSIGHGLSKDLELIFVKNRDANSSWITQWVGNPLADYMYLNNTTAQSTTTIFNLDITRNNDGTFHYGVAQYLGANNIDYLAYCFHSVAGYSKIGEYTGNGNASGPFINTGFKPAWVMIKRTDAEEGWYIRDTTRETFNPLDTALLAQVSDAEVSSSNYEIDYLSNGFKPRTSHASSNANSGTYLYMAFAESPFKTANAR